VNIELLAPNGASRPENEMASAIPQTAVTHQQRSYARLAGVLLLGIIALAIAGGAILSNIVGNGNFQETASRIAASQHLYRLALSSAVIVSLSSTLLAFALYATLKPVNQLPARLGMIFTLADSFLALVVRMCSFVRLHLYLSAQTPGAVNVESLQTSCAPSRITLKTSAALHSA
jgi:hypothetical protein